MTIAVHEYPFSSYVQKAKTAFYEERLPFEPKMIDGSGPVASGFAALWPIRRRAARQAMTEWMRIRRNGTSHRSVACGVERE
jgi:hypothetical protein